MLGLTQIPRPMMEHTCKDTHLPPGTQKILLMQPHIPTHRRLIGGEPQQGTCILRVRGDRYQYGQKLPHKPVVSPAAP